MIVPSMPRHDFNFLLIPALAIHAGSRVHSLTFPGPAQKEVVLSLSCCSKGDQALGLFLAHQLEFPSRVCDSLDLVFTEVTQGLVKMFSVDICMTEN